MNGPKTALEYLTPVQAYFYKFIQLHILVDFDGAIVVSTPTDFNNF